MKLILLNNNIMICRVRKFVDGFKPRLLFKSRNDVFYFSIKFISKNKVFHAIHKNFNLIRFSNRAESSKKVRHQHDI